MDQTGNTSSERLGFSNEASGLNVPQQEKPKTAKEVGKKAKEVLRADSAEAAEGSEGAEGIDGKVSESSGEDKAFAPISQGVKTKTADEIEAIRAKLLAIAPPQKEMIRQIRAKLVRQEKVLTKRMNKLQKSAHRHAFELAGVIAQLREVGKYFSMLAHATYELIKHLWLKIVHGV